MTACVQMSLEGSVARVRLNRPHRRNAVDQAMSEALHGAIEELHGRRDVAVVVVEGAGDHFCAGWDLSEFEGLATATDDEVARRMGENVLMLRRLGELPQFTVALVEGYAAGFGVALAVSADLVVADPGARFFLPEAELGLVPTVVLPSLVQNLGPRTALWTALIAAPVTAERAQAVGMVGMLADAGEREALVARLAKLPPGVIRSTKRLARDLSGASHPEIDRMVGEATVATLRSEEARRIMNPR